LTGWVIFREYKMNASSAPQYERHGENMADFGVAEFYADDE